MDDFTRLIPANTPTAARPLLGLTVLVVEDSRFASDAMRLMCLKSGARIRRADCLKAARRHLKVYRPSVAVVDLGLPDGSGLDLIRDLARAPNSGTIILALSGDVTTASAAKAAGADAFLAKPLGSIAAFQEAIVAHLPADRRPPGLRSLTSDCVQPDPIAFADDLTHAADVLDEARDEGNLAYITQFLSGVALSAGDRLLQAATDELIRKRQTGKPTKPSLARLTGLVQSRLAEQRMM